MAMALFKSKEQECIDLLRSTHEERSQIAADILAKQAELAELTAGRTDAAALTARRKGEVAIGGVVAASVVERQLADLFGCRRELIREWKDARLNLEKFRLAAIHKEADKLQDKLDKHNGRTAELLVALQDHAGCYYEAVLKPRGDTLYGPGGAEIGHFPHEGPRIPKAFEMEHSIETLRAQARAAEARAQQSCEGGSIAAEDLEGLLKITQDAEQLAPLAAEITAWHATAAARLDQEWRDFLDTPGLFTDQRYVISRPGRETRFTVHWDAAGELDQAKSSAVNIKQDVFPMAPPPRPPVAEGMEYSPLR